MSLRYLSTSLLFLLYFLFTAKKCSTSSLNSSCPPNSLCSQIQADILDGLCKCNADDKYVLNLSYTNDTDYCKYDPNLIVNDNRKDTSTNDSNKTEPKKPEASLAAAPDKRNNSQISASEEVLKIQPLPGAHHVIGGILIPIFFVMIALGAIYGVRRLHIQQRVRNIRMTRRNRPFYEDVMLGSNEHDDPPLI